MIMRHSEQTEKREELTGGFAFDNCSFLPDVTHGKGGGEGENFQRGVAREGAKWGVTRGSNTLEVSKQQRDATNSEMESSVTKGAG